MNKVKLGDVLDVKRGASLSGEYYSCEGEKIRLTIGNFNYPSGGFQENTSKDDLFFVGPVGAEFILKKGDIITPLTEQVSGLLGETARIPEGDLYIQSGDIGLVLPNEELLDPDYAYYLVSSSVVKKQLDAASQQTKIRHTSPEAIKRCVAWLPSLERQRSAAHLLDLLNQIIENNNEIVSELRTQADCVYSYWFHQYDFPDSSGKPYRSSGGSMTFSDELNRPIPTGWEIGSLYSIASFVNGLACQKHRPKDGDVGLPVIKIKEMHNGYSQNTERVSSFIPDKNVVIDGDILFSWSASLEVMYWNYGTGGLNQHIFKVVPVDNFSSQFVFHQLTDYVQTFIRIAEARKTTMGHITQDHLRQSRIAIPPFEVIDEFTRIIKPMHELMNRKLQENGKLIDLRNWLATMLLNGQIAAGSE